MHLPRSAARYITLQRLATQGVGKSIHYSPIGAVAYRIYEKSPLAQRAFRFYSSSLEPQLRARRILSDYEAIMAGEFATIQAHLPARAERVIGLGPGVAGLEVFICQWYKELTGVMPQVVLIDKTGIDSRIHFGFQEVAAVYNSLATAKEVLQKNGVPAAAITPVDAEDASLWGNRNRQTADLITSLIAWGFHFPVAAYRDFALAALKSDGTLIIDVRKETSGRVELEAVFGEVKIILDDPKFDRLVCRQPSPPSPG
jgi:hypothetical protein